MDFHQFLQSLQFSSGEVPNGFALVPMPMFLMMAGQGQVVPLPIAQPAWNGSLYDRAMVASPN